MSFIYLIPTLPKHVSVYLSLCSLSTFLPARSIGESERHTTPVMLTKVCDWSHLPAPQFYAAMRQNNLLMEMGRPSSAGAMADTLPTLIDVSWAILSMVTELKDDPGRSLAALVQKVKDDSCPVEDPNCLQGYYRDCRDNGTLTSSLSSGGRTMQIQTKCDNKLRGLRQTQDYARKTLARAHSLVR